MDLHSFNNEETALALTELADPAIYRGYLQTMSRFSGYSWRNIFLIYKQMPEATKIADYDTWKTHYGRSIKRHSTGIKINVPIEQKPKKKFAVKIDPSTGAAAIDENGKKIMEEVIVDVPVKFRKDSYFDISQTEGNPVLRLAGDVMTDETLRGVFTDVLKTMVFTAPEPFDYNSAIKQLTRERLENNNSGKNDFITDSVSCVVCLRFGVDAGHIDFDNHPDAETLEIIGKLADGIITDIEDRFAVLCKERGFDPMTTHKPAEPLLIAEPEAVTTEEPQYKKELRTETVAGVEFEQYSIKPFSADVINETDAVETDISASPLPAAVKISEITTQVETTITTLSEPPVPPVKSKPGEPPELKHFPDPSITIAERNEYGYTRPELLPLRKGRAVTLFMRDMTVYLLHKNNTETMALKITDIQNHDGIYGVAYGAWLNDKEYIYLASGKPEDRREAKFIFDGGDSFAVYQTKETDDSPNAFKTYEELEKQGLDINRRKYNLVYTAPLPAPPSDCPSGLYMWVNSERLDDYNGRALSTSDVLSIKKDEIITSYYTNGRIFKELLSFMGEEGRKYRRRFEIEAAESTVIPVEENVIQETVQEKQKDDAVIPVTEEPPQLQQQSEPPVTTPTSAETAIEAPAELTDIPQSSDIQSTVTKKTETAEHQPPLSSTLQSAEPPAENTAAQTEQLTTQQTKTKPPPNLPIIRSEAAVYRFSLKEAELMNALEAHDLSRRADIECAKIIDQAIQAHKNGDNDYDLTTPAQRLTKRYGKDRMKWVLAQHIRARQAGFKSENIAWANVSMEEEPGSGDLVPPFTFNTHRVVLEAFVNEVRAILEQKSFSDLMKTAKRKSDAHNKSSGK